MTDHDETSVVEESLSRPEIHDGWESAYRTEKHERFADLSFDRAIDVVGAPPDSLWLDVGCGPAFHALRLARRGYRVEGLDISEGVLESGRRNVEQAGLGDRIRLSAGSLLELPFADQSVDYILCWGVLMHVPDIEGAVGEMSRVLRPGGRLLISENNVRSWDNILIGLADRFRGGSVERRDTPMGVERWFETPGGTLLTRQCDLDRLVAEFERHGVLVRHWLAGSLTEIYTKLGDGVAAHAVHRLNAFWLRSVRRPRPATGNLLVFERGA